jgi:hypothetical protein
MGDETSVSVNKIWISVDNMWISVDETWILRCALKRTRLTVD